MSLWNKSLADVTFADLDAFCRSEIPEGLRLDYKREIPNNLAKTLAAFANTRGGLLLLGVHSDPTTNRPIWPCPGMPSRAGYTEQIAQIGSDNVYPPILPEFSPIIADPNNAGRVFLVARVDESPLAPHSVDHGKRVYIRSNDTTDHFDLADIDRIEMMLNRRRQLDESRNMLVNAQINRAVRRYPRDDSFCWWACAPLFPHGNICVLDECRLGLLDVTPHRGPDGFYGLDSYPVQAEGEARDRKYSGCGRRGEMIFSRSFRSQTTVRIDGSFIATQTLAFLENCLNFYSRDVIQHPGALVVSIGFGRVTNVIMKRQDGMTSETRFPDDDYRVERRTTIDELRETAERESLAFDLVSEVFHAFDVPPPLPVNLWNER